MNFWHKLSMREQRLLGAAGVLLLIAAIIFLGIRPVLNAKSDAQRAQISAQKDLVTVRQGVQLLGGASTSSTGTQTFDRNAVLQMVQANGLTMSRIQPESSGALKLWFEEATSAKVFKFISDTVSTYAATVSSVQITRKQNGLINVTITLRPLSA